VPVCWFSVDIVYDPTRTAKLAMLVGKWIDKSNYLSTNVVVGSWINNVQSGARVLLIDCEP